ncbi:MAG TPA: SpoIIE family protein phosphatase [Methanoregulaceae archaeon]|nr:SpoIIE family protein phosphatase [Methanoregulaceae archaeon]
MDPMLPSLISTTIVLFQMMCVIVVFAYLITRTRFFDEVLVRQFTWKNQIFLIVLFGILSIYGSESGISVLGAQINIRDLGPMVAGLVAGPIVGVGAGLIGASYRMTMGGFTLVPCSLATVLAGLLAGMVYILAGRKFPGILIAVSFAIIMEGLHMGLVLLISRPISQAVEVVSDVALPMIAANAAGMFIFSFIIANLLKEKQTQEERDRYHKELERKNAELQIAHEIQTSFLPEAIPRIPGYSLAAMSIPAREVGGDFYDIIPFSGHKTGILIADVSDKGVPAALFMALSRTVVRANAVWHPKARNAIQGANAMISADARSGMFVTLFFGILDNDSRRISYVNAGHNPPLLFREGSSPVPLTPTGIALGAIDDAEYGEESIDLNDGDVLVLYTDGVTEAMDSQNNQFGEERLAEMVSPNLALSAEAILEKVCEGVRVHTGDAPQFDDVTLMILKVGY